MSDAHAMIRNLRKPKAKPAAKLFPTVVEPRPTMCPDCGMKRSKKTLHEICHICGGYLQEVRGDG